MIAPTAEQELLLRAALSPPAGPFVVGQALRDVDVRRLDATSRRLLPLLVLAPRAQEPCGALLEMAEREYRRTAARNAALFDRGRKLIEDLDTAGVETLVLKGAALVPRYYRDPGLRPMADLDILIPIKAFFPALAALQRAGWRPHRTVTPSLVRTTHAAPFTTADGFVCDLHWRVFPEPGPPGAEAALWAASVDVDFYGTKTRALSSTDQLLHVCLHGARWGPVPAIWWIVDAVAIIRAGDVDWDRLVSQAVTYRFVLRLRDALRYLRTLGAAVPADILGTLETVPASALERLERRAVAREHRLLGVLLVHWCNYLRSHEGARRGGFVPYLRDVWGLKSSADVPRAAANRAVVRVAAALRSAR
jgi:hypothetical protein